MLKAIFIDFYGTLVHEMGPIAEGVVQQIYQGSNAKSPEEVLRYWWKIFREKLENANGEYFRTQREVALDTFGEVLRRFDSPAAPQNLLARMIEHWCTTTAYPDAEMFMEAVSLPVYFVTNSDDDFLLAAMKHNGLHPAGFVTSEQARYSKPRKEIFLYALEKNGLRPDEVIHIGDSLRSDVECPCSVGIKSIWLNREKKPVPPGVFSVDSLQGVLEILEKEAE